MQRHRPVAESWAGHSGDAPIHLSHAATAGWPFPDMSSEGPRAVPRRFAIHRQFLESMGRLTPNEQSRVRSTIDQVTAAERPGGLRWHKVGKFVSLSPSTDLRIICFHHDDSFTLAYVDHHDAAYKWAERHTPIRAETGDLLALVAGLPPPDPAAGGNKLPYRGIDDIRFAGLPEPVASWLRTLGSEEELLDAVSSLAPELQEHALNEAVLAQEPSLSNGVPSDIVVVDNDRVLEYALRFPAQTWRIFLHPGQRYVVNMPLDAQLLLRGGPGTGKTVTLVHRFARLHTEAAAARNRKLPLLMTFCSSPRQLLVMMLRTLGISDADNQVVSWSVPNLKLKEVFARIENCSCVLVDEAQDMPNGYMLALSRRLRGGLFVPPRVIALDYNQSNQGDYSPLEGLLPFFDTVTLSHNYRSTAQIARACTQLISHLHKHYSVGNTKLKDEVTRSYRSSIHGPEIEIASFNINDVDSLPRMIKGYLARITRDYPRHDGLAVIYVRPQHTRSPHFNTLMHIRREVSLAFPSIPFLSSLEAKGHEYFAGAVIDVLTYPPSALYCGVDPMTAKKYRTMLRAYVALSRFRDRVMYVATSANSPLISPT